MPHSNEDHITYTRNEFTNLNYYKQVLQILKEKKIKSYLDIGANVGEVCNIFFEQIPTLEKAYLFEPEKTVFDFLQKNVKTKNNVELFNIAIYYGLEKPKIFKNFNPGGNIISSTPPDQQGFSNYGEIENYSTLESMNIPLVDMIKIDIEGGEYDVIKNSTYLHMVNLLEIEFHYDSNSFDIVKFTKEFLSDYDIIVEEDIKGRFLFQKK